MASPSPTPSSTHPKTPPSTPPSFGYSPTADAKAQIDAARAAAKADGRAVLLEFGADWCGSCQYLGETFHNPGVLAELASAYHLVQIDVDAHGDLLSKYAPGGSGGYGLPVMVVLGPDGTTRVDTHKTGNPDLDPSSFLAFLKKWAA